MLIHSVSTISIHRVSFQLSAMSDNSDSQNRSEEQVNLSEGTSPSDSYDDGSRSTPSNLPKAATRQRRKRNSDSEDEDFVADEEVTSRKKVVKKEFGTAASTKPGMKKKAPAKRIPMSKARASTQETIEFTLEPKEAGEGKKRKERVKKTMARVIGRPSMVRDSDEDEEDAAPAPKAQKLMGDAIKSGAAPSKPKTAPKAAAAAQASKPAAPKRSTRNIPAAEKNKAPVPEVEEEEEAQVLRKLKPKIPDHDDTHPVAENMKLRKDAGLRLWRQTDPYATRRRTAVDYRFHTKEQQDFYETVLLDKKPIVSDMRWVDWTYIDNNADHFPGVHDSFKLNGVDKFVGQKLTKWNDEMVMQFYSTAHFYPDGKIVWMTEGTRYQSTVAEWAKLINAPEEQEDDTDVYAKPRKGHNSMAHMYKEIPDAALDTHKFGSVYYLLSGLPTINTILRHTLLPKSGDDRMIRGHSINLLHMFDIPEKFKVMTLIVETIKRTAADQKRSCGYAPHIQMLINSKMGKGTYLLDKEHLPLLPEFEAMKFSWMLHILLQ
jgi:hypothetical protein